MRINKIKLIFLIFLIIPIMVACTTTKKFELEGNWKSTSKNVDTNSEYSIIKKLNLTQMG